MSPDANPDFYSTATSVARILVCHVVTHILLDQFWRRVAPHKYHSLAPPLRIALSERVISTANAINMCWSAFSLIYLRPEVFGGRALTAYPREAHELFSYYLAYITYDMAAMALEGAEHKSFWAHHLLGFTGAVGIMVMRRPVFYPLLFGISECTAIANNLLWFGEHVVYAPRKILVVTHVLRALSFIFGRVWIAPYALFHVLREAGFSPLRLGQQWFQGEIHPVAALMTAFNVTALGYVNIGWTIAVIKIALRELGLRKGSGGAKKKKPH